MIASGVEGRTASQCQGRWRKTLDPSIYRGRWTDAETRLLVQAVKRHGGQWIKVQAMVPGRTDVQCRERYMNRGKSGIGKGPWSSAEDSALLEAVDRSCEERKMQLPLWGQVAGYMQEKGHVRRDDACQVQFGKLDPIRMARFRAVRNAALAVGKAGRGGNTRGRLHDPSEDTEDTEPVPVPPSVDMRSHDRLWHVRLPSWLGVAPEIDDPELLPADVSSDDMEMLYD